MGNPVIDGNVENYRIPFAHGMGLISDELYQSLLKHCKGEYINVDSRNVLCSRYLKSFDETYGYLLSSYWANDDKVRNALNVRKGTTREWRRCTKEMPYEIDIPSSLPYQVNLSKKGYRSLIYSGDHDMIVPFLATQAEIRSLNYSIVDDWRPWNTNGQVAGYTRTYSNAMTFATVKGGGHTAPEYKPQECFHMYTNWISEMPF
ncbi:hypothetical protein PIB30_038675 [Stylosanthes scabra]|uniref:Uncharacterized protein n=1 Tax=Stylosanthes scabra TaxID=79078 RepID=A0ABU6YCX2_9FABA|nr:hypothetical protein [Stylosanthes scabra]